MAIYINSGSRPSNSARALARAMGVRRIKLRNSQYVPRARDTIINWGLTDDLHPARIVNLRASVAAAVDKRMALAMFWGNDVNCPFSTTTKNVMEATRVASPNMVVLARTNPRGSGGEGIIVVKPGEPIPDAPLYVEYIPKRYELRIHVVNGERIFWQQKMNRLGDQQDNWHVRSHANGFVFAHINTSAPAHVVEQCTEQAIRAVDALGLDFGAVDVIFNERRNQAYVLEINTAPGLEGATVEAYRQAFTRWLG